jgi:hypothetical protein
MKAKNQNRSCTQQDATLDVFVCDGLLTLGIAGEVRVTSATTFPIALLIVETSSLKPCAHSFSRRKMKWKTAIGPNGWHSSGYCIEM